MSSAVQSAAIAQGAAGTTEVVAAPGAGKSIVVYGYTLAMELAGTAKWQSASTDLTGAMPLATNGVLPVSGGTVPIMRCAANEALNLTTATGAAKGHVWYTIEG